MGEKTRNIIKTTELKRVTWKEGKVLAFETPQDVWVLGQLIGLTKIAFFDAFAKQRKFTVEDWESAKLLYVTAVTDQFLRATTVCKTELPAKSGIPLPTAWINKSIFPQYKKVILWEGTAHERRLKVEFGGSLVCYSGKGDYWPSEHDILIERIRINDRKTIDNHELSGSAVNPYTNHRLYLCYKLKRNADPMKELAFRHPLPPEYKTVIDNVYPDDHF